MSWLQLFLGSSSFCSLSRIVDCIFSLSVRGGISFWSLPWKTERQEPLRLQCAILAVTSLCCQSGCETPSDVEAVVTGRRKQAPEMLRCSRTFPLTVLGQRVWGLLYELLHLGNSLHYAPQRARNAGWVMSHWDSSTTGHAGSLSDFDGGRGEFPLDQTQTVFEKSGPPCNFQLHAGFSIVSQTTTELLFNGHHSK